MIVQAAADQARAVAQRTRHAHLGSNGFANKCALIRQFIEKFRQLFLDFEGNNGGLLLTRHDGAPWRPLDSLDITASLLPAQARGIYGFARKPLMTKNCMNPLDRLDKLPYHVV